MKQNNQSCIFSDQDAVTNIAQYCDDLKETTTEIFSWLKCTVFLWTWC